MRGLAFGVLDPDGERYRLALIHIKSRKNDNVPKTALQSQRNSGEYRCVQALRSYVRIAQAG